MDVYDSTAVRKIWQRVGLTSEACGADPILPLIRSEWDLAAAVHAVPGPVWASVSRQAFRRAAKLRAIHYMQTGQPVPRSCPKPERARMSPQLLRGTIGQLQRLTQNYHQTAAALPDYQNLLAAFAVETEAAARLLLGYLADMV